MPKTSSHFAIIGRIPDSEQVSFVTPAEDRKTALVLFEAHLYADETRGTKARVIREHGVAVFVDGIFQSSSPIAVL